MHALETVVTANRREDIKIYGCEGCLVEGCGDCPFCVNKPKFGGPGRKQLCCVK